VLKETPKGNVLEFGLAVTGGYGEDAPTHWYDVAVWNEGLIESAKREVLKGSKVAVEGFFSEREYNGKVYNKISATRIGIVEWLRRSPRTAAAGAAATSEAEW
jgi:single-stranded DNA-binding protein